MLPSFILLLALQGIPHQIVVETKTLPDPLFKVSVARGELTDHIAEFRKTNSKTSARKIEANLETILVYIRTVSKERPKFAPTDVMKRLSQEELGREVLKLAEQLRPEIQKMTKAESLAIVDVKHWEFLYGLESELLRLKWMVSQFH